MNHPHYHHSPYQEMNSPHSPHSDVVSIGYHGHGPPPPQCGPPPSSNGHLMIGGPLRPHHEHLHPHPAFTGGGGPPVHPDVIPNSMHHHHHHPHHHLHHHMISASSNTNNSNNMGVVTGSSNNNSNNPNNNNNGGNNSNSNSSSSNNGGNNHNNNNNNNNSHHRHHHNNNGAMMNGNSGNIAAAQNCIGPPNIKICSGCGRKIVERYLLHALDRYWHHCCLKCHCCGTMLADIGSSCFTRNDMILCKADYIRLYGNTGACAACGQTIPASEFVMRVGNGPLGSNGMPSSPAGTHHVFHLKCFTCSKCGAPLVSGDRYYLLAGSLVCEQDWHKLLKGTGGAGLNTNTGTTGQQNASTGTTTVRKGKVGRPRRTRE